MSPAPQEPGAPASAGVEAGRPSGKLRRLPGLVGLVALALLAGCAWLPRATPTPIPSRTWKAPGAPSGTLIVFLPGRGDRMDDFESRGLLAEMRRAGIHADVTAVDAHLGYYRRRTVITRLREDVIAPARTTGYRRIVVVGISLGGLGGLLGERETPGLADALVLIAPYLGDNPRLFGRIRSAGGPDAWAAGRDPQAGKVDALIWTFLGQHHRELPPTWLLYGTDDPYREGQSLFGSLLPSGRVLTTAGGHTWAAWTELWRRVCVETDVFAGERESR